jgi:hypothetical protein
MVESYVQRAKRCLCCEHRRDPRRALPPTSPASSSTYTRRAHQPRSDPHNPAPPRGEECDSRSASLFSPEPPATPAQTEKFLHVALCVEFAKTAGALAALARHPLLAEPILYRSTSLGCSSLWHRGEDYSCKRSYLSWVGVIRLLCPSIALVYCSGV